MGVQTQIGLEFSDRIEADQRSARGDAPSMVAELTLYVDFPADSTCKTVRFRPRSPEMLDV